MNRPHHLSLGRRGGVYYWPDGGSKRWMHASRQVGPNRGLNLTLHGKRFNVQVIYVLRFAREAS